MEVFAAYLGVRVFIDVNSSRCFATLIFAT